LRFVTSEAYDHVLKRVRNAVVERSLEEYVIDQPIGAADEGAPRYRDDLQHADIEGICANPLRDEPHPAIIAAVRRFGAVGLIAAALGAAVVRWWNTVAR
jgi:hypothetical protein